MWLLAPAAATVLALVLLTVGLRRAARATEALRSTLRRSAATSVASDELLRAVSNAADHAEATRASSDRLRGRQDPRSRGASSDRLRGRQDPRSRLRPRR